MLVYGMRYVLRLVPYWVDKGVKAPQMPSNIRITRIEQWDDNKIVTYHREER